MHKAKLILFAVLMAMMLMTGCARLQIKNDTVCNTVKFDWQNIVDSGLNEQNRASMLLFYCLCNKDTKICK